MDGSMFDPNGPSLFNVTIDDGLWGNAHFDPFYVA